VEQLLQDKLDTSVQFITEALVLAAAAIEFIGFPGILEDNCEIPFDPRHDALDTIRNHPPFILLDFNGNGLDNQFGIGLRMECDILMME
jgi:hypothetical protein